MTSEVRTVGDLIKALSDLDQNAPVFTERSISDRRKSKEEWPPIRVTPQKTSVLIS